MKSKKIWCETRIRDEYKKVRLSARIFSHSVCNTAQKMKFFINPN